MSIALENAALRLHIDLEASSWSLFSKQADRLGVNGLQIGLSYRRGGALTSLRADWRTGQVEQSVTAGVHGQLALARLRFPVDAHSVWASLTFAMPQGAPLLLWQLQIMNRSSRPIHLERLDLLRLEAPDGRLRLGNEAPEALAFFSNGWQSWSYSGAYAAAERFRATRLGPIRLPAEANPASPQPSRPGHFSSEMFAVVGDRQTRWAVLLGCLSQQEHFSTVEAQLDQPFPYLGLYASGDGARLDPGAALATDWACLGFLHVDDAEPLGPYLEAVARQAGIGFQEAGFADPLSDSAVQIPKFKIHNWTGWCSWYQYAAEDFTAVISAGDVRQNLQAMVALRPNLPLEVCQIDDGYESWVGDWFLPAQGFSDGMAPLAAEIRAAGCTPGLWLSPFIVDPRSRLAIEHPDWLLRGRFNRPINAGFFWNQFVTALDPTHPQALDYVRSVISTAVHQWGFSYLKLDFLYAAALPGDYHDPTRSRAQALRAGLLALRQAAGPDAVLLGCSCPLGPAIGLVDAMRIGADTHRRWYPSFKGVEAFFRDETSLPSAANALHNAITRAPLHRRWWANDPDCLLLRPDTQLTRQEVLSVATVISLTGGSLLLSDDLEKLPPERRWIAEVLLPLIGERPQVPGWLDAPFPPRLRLDLKNAAGEWSLLALFNWEDRGRDMVLKPADYFTARSPFPWQGPEGQLYLRRFWQADQAAGVHRLSANAALPIEAMPPHSVALFAARPVRLGEAQYLGSDLHISQGLELAEWQAQDQLVRLRLQRPGRAAGRVYLALPAPPRRIVLDGQPLQAQSCGLGCYAFSVEFVKSGDLIVELS